jgi:hypothetical protein
LVTELGSIFFRRAIYEDGRYEQNNMLGLHTEFHLIIKETVMKQLLLLLLVLPLFIFAQEPPKKASKIIVLRKDTSNSLLDKIALELFNRRFTIETRDDKLKYLTTKERTNVDGTKLTKIRVILNDTAIIFTSEMAFAQDFIIGGVTLKQTFDPVTYSGLKKSYMMNAWREMDEIAKTFGDKIIYSK